MRRRFECRSRRRAGVGSSSASRKVGVIWGEGPRRDAEAAAAGRSGCAGFALRCTATISTVPHSYLCHPLPCLRPADRTRRQPCEARAGRALRIHFEGVAEAKSSLKHNDGQDLLDEPRAPAAASMAEASLQNHSSSTLGGWGSRFRYDLCSEFVFCSVSDVVDEKKHVVQVGMRHATMHTCGKGTGNP